MPARTDNRPRPRKRTGVRARPAAARPAVAAQPSGMIAELLAMRGGECGRPGGMGCDITMPGSGLVPLSIDPVLAGHAERGIDPAPRPGAALELDPGQARAGQLPEAP